VILRAETARVAVVIVNYQSYAELRECLRSLQRADESVSVVVVDHASRAADADALSQAFPDVHVMRIEGNDGFAVGVNRGVAATRAPFALLLNPDCAIDAKTPGDLANWMERHPAVAVLGPRIRNADGTVQASARRFPNLTTALGGRSSWLTRVFPSNPLSRRNLPLRNASTKSAVEVDWVSGACMLVRRKAFDAVGGLDEGFFLYWEDADFCRRLHDAGWHTAYLPTASAVHVGGRSSRHAADASLEAFHRSALRLYRKHAGVAGRLLTPVVYAGLQLRLAFMKALMRKRRSAAARESHVVQ
jgi:GT2 family glycosyltransferase